MTTTLCFDFGNTRLKAALYIDGKIKETFVLENDAEKHLEEIIDTFHPDHSILSSVIDHSLKIEEILKTKQNFISFHTSLIYLLQFRWANPKQ